jgi:hypothetical protein
MSRAIRFSFMFLVLFITGCVNKSEDNGLTTIGYDWWVGMLVLVGGIGATVAGFMMIRDESRYAWGLIIGGPLAALFSPGFFMEKMTVDAKHFYLRTGFWMSPTVVEFDYAQIHQVTLTERTSTSRRGSRTNYYAECKIKGSKDYYEVPLSNTLMDNGGNEVFLQMLVKNKIPVINKLKN